MIRVNFCLLAILSAGSSISWAQEPAATTPAEEGYQYRRSQVWTDPDGSTLRQHEHTMTGSDPYNFTREHLITLPDGRVISQTQVRSWDGATGTMERTMIGPNGQVREFTRNWVPDEQNTVQPGTASGAAPRSTPAQATPAAAGRGDRLQWWQKLNPFHKRQRETAGSSAAVAQRKGFTIGTRSSSSAQARSAGPAERPVIRGSQDTHRPSWAGGVSRSMSPQGPPVHAHGQATAVRPNPGRGRNR